MAEEKKQTLQDKLFKNEKGEISLRKTGIIATAFGGFLVANPLTFIPGCLIIAKGLTAIGATFAAIGQFAKTDRS